MDSYTLEAHEHGDGSLCKKLHNGARCFEIKVNSDLVLASISRHFEGGGEQ